MKVAYVSSASGHTASSKRGDHGAEVVGMMFFGCFPDLHGALAGNPPDHVITL